VGDERQWVATHLASLTGGVVRTAGRHRGGQTAADAALSAFDVRGYRSERNEVWPPGRRGASGLSPWIRHGLITLQRVWDHVADGPPADVEKFRDELLWQEYARHRYARHGRTRPAVDADDDSSDGAEWSDLERNMACLADQFEELDEDGWITNQARMWLAAQWSGRSERNWTDGEEWMFRQLLDGSRAANGLGWAWTSGVGRPEAYVFTRRQVERRAPGRCASCALNSSCPIGNPPPFREPPVAPAHAADEPARVWGGPTEMQTTRGPGTATAVDRRPTAVWITAESLGDDDPALQAHPDLPAVFVFDEPLLRHLRLASLRLVFLTECLADLATRRTVEVHLGDPVVVLAERAVATTAAPVPGARRRRTQLGDAVVELHPWPWLVPPHDGRDRSFSAWRRAATL
jgi:deoxyribodipyrimidine photo-lyase